MSMHEETIGLIGIGLVGSVLADKLLAANYPVIGYDIDPAACDRFSQRGGRITDCPAKVAGAAKTLLLSLPDTGIVRQVVEGPAGVLNAPNTPAYIIDTTTGDPTETAELAARLNEKGIAYLDATISGASSQIRNGQALFMVGGDRKIFGAVEPVLRLFSDRVFYVGPSGSGAKSKLATNLILGLNRLVLAEGLVFAENLGLDLRTFMEILRVSPAYSGAVDVKGEKLLRNDFTPDSRIRQHFKDVTLILKYADESGQDLPLSRVHLDILTQTIAAGEGDLDTCAVIKEIRRRTAIANRNK